MLTISTGAVNIDAVTGSGLTLTLAGTGNTTINSVIQDFSGGTGTSHGALSITNTGTTTLGGTNTFAGGLTFNASNVTVKVPSASGLGTGAINLGGNFTGTGLTLGSGSTTTSANALSFNGNGTQALTITLDAPSSQPGITQTFGVLSLGQQSTLTINQTANLTSPSTVVFGNSSFSQTTASGKNSTIAPAGVSVQIGTMANVDTTGGTSTLTLGGTSTGNTIGAISDNSGTAFSAVTKSNTSTWTLTGANTYTGATTVNAGTLVLDYATNASVLSSSSALTLGGGTLQLKGKTGASTTAQTLASLSLTAGTASAINLVSNGGTSTKLTITSTTVTTGAGASVNFNYFDGGAGTTNGATVGNDIVAWNPTLTAGIIGGTYTVTDAGGTGFATTSGGNVVRLADPGSAGLPVSGGVATTNYFINQSYSTVSTSTPGSLVEALSGPVAAQNVTVDTTGLTSGANLALGTNKLTLTIGGGMIFSGANPYTITGTTNGITSSATGTITLNNNLTGGSLLTISASDHQHHHRRDLHRRRHHGSQRSQYIHWRDHHQRR